MTVLRVAPAIFEAFPDVRIGVVTFEGVRNDADAPELGALLDRESADALRRLGTTPVAEHPRVASWREAYRRFGAKPKDHPSSIENLLRRVARSAPPRRIHPLVDLYNAVSLRHFVPVGGEDLDAVSGVVELRFAREGEPAASLSRAPVRRSRARRSMPTISARSAAAGTGRRRTGRS
jgi:DNA/RNA-binding domain of Phe-tRNA-synthetase-like protein